MSRPPKPIIVTESLVELKRLHKQSASHLKPRVQMLILSKQSKAFGKYALSDALGVNHNSVQSWRKSYEQGGVERLLQDKRGGNRAAVIDEKTDKAIEVRLSDAKDAPRSFKELQQWVHDNYVKDINYHTLHKHVKRKYGAKLKVARKSHVNKDEQAVEAFKKNR
jgi:transposase